jgi:signal transduction histidine kinase
MEREKIESKPCGVWDTEWYSSMRSSLQFRLFVNGLVILLIGMGLAGFLFWRSAANLYLETQRQNLLAQAQLTAATLQGQSLPATPAETYSQTSNVMPGIHTRVLSGQGAVIIGLPVTAGGLPVQMPEAEGNTLVSPDDLLRRSEIISALDGVSSTAMRTVLNGNHRVLYAAAPVYANDNSISGLVYLAVPLPAGGLPSAFIFELAIAGLAAVGLALAAGTLLSRQVTKPVEAIISSAKAVSSGDLDQHVPEAGGVTELDSLGQTFNHMVASLKQSDQAQNAFVADVAHELRTPLTVIKGTVETLEDGAVDDLEGRGPLLTSMQRETDRLIRLVNNLLVLTRADAGMLNLDIKPLDLTNLARQRCNQLAPLASPRKVVFTINSPQPALVNGDEDRLAQVLDNLLNNALRYSPDRGIVTMNIDVAGDVCEVRVHDNGSGIPSEHLPRIFERFYRVEASRSRQGGEAGLGLSIVRALVQSHGGRVFTESQPGEGTTVGFSLPVAHKLNES